MSLVPNTLAYLLKFKHKHWIQILHLCLLHKPCPIQTNSVSFQEPNIWKKIVNMFVSFLNKCPIIAIWGRWDQKFGKFIAFSAETTIHNSQYNTRAIKLWAKDYPHGPHFRSVTYNRIRANVLQLLIALILWLKKKKKKIMCMFASFLKHVSINARWAGARICKIHPFFQWNNRSQL